MSTILLKDKIEILEKIGIEKQVENSVNKIIDFQLAKYQKIIQEITSELKIFENSFQLTSTDFYKKFNSGEIGDASDYIEWASLYENFVYYNEKIELLKSAA
jgi:tRNA A-37 threonylcarbamoyl transferase component Bud32